MIEIKAKLIRADSAIYATGEKVECLIEFTNKAEANDNEAFGGHLENLAWASVQIHCYRKTTFSRESANSITDLTEMIGKTALDAVTQTPGEIIVETKPKILFCDLKLRPAESKIYFFNDFVPRDGPPTYRGHDIKYFYKITIATQRVKSKVQSLTVPIRVLPIPVIPRPEELLGTETNDELTPTNPFLEKREITELEVSWHHLKNVTARRSPKFFRITNKRGYVGRFCLFKTAYKLGEDIVGSLDFANCEVRCVQFSVKLQSEEVILRKSAQAKDDADTASINSDVSSIAVEGSKSSQAEDMSGKISTYATSHQVCYSMMQTQLIIPIPLHSAPSFRTDLVDVRWRLHFEFVSSTTMDIGKPNFETGELTAPQEIPVETMIWNLPITIYSANPLQIYSPSPAYSLFIK